MSKNKKDLNEKYATHKVWSNFVREGSFEHTNCPLIVGDAVEVKIVTSIALILFLD